VTVSAKVDRIKHLALTALVVTTLAAAGAMIGARLWPRVVKIEHYALAPDKFLAPSTPAVDTLPDLIERLCPAVVTLDYGTSRGDLQATAAGIVISADGFIATSGRDINRYAYIRATQADGVAHDAIVVALDDASGLAMLKIEGSKLPALTWLDASMPRIGTTGFVLTGGQGRGCAVESGLVGSDFVAERETLAAFFKMTPGFDVPEGSPIIGTAGEVLGLVGARVDTKPERAGKIVPGRMAGQIMSEMLRTGKPPNAPFGILVIDLDPVLARRLQANRQRGALVMFVQPASSADKAGIKAGDLIVSVATNPVAGASEFGRALDPDAKVVEVDLVRRGTRKTIELRK
jgi:serine protease Do